MDIENNNFQDSGIESSHYMDRINVGFQIKKAKIILSNNMEHNKYIRMNGQLNENCCDNDDLTTP